MHSTVKVKTDISNYSKYPLSLLIRVTKMASEKPEENAEASQSPLLFHIRRFPPRTIPDTPTPSL